MHRVILCISVILLVFFPCSFFPVEEEILDIVASKHMNVHFLGSK